MKTNERDPKSFDLYRYDAKTYERTMAYKDEASYELGAISDDGQWMAFQKPKTTSDSDIYLWSAATKEMKHVTPHEGQSDNVPEQFDPASKALYYLSNDGAEFPRVRKYDLATGKHEDVEKADWDVSATSFSHNGKYRVTAVNDDGRTVIRVVETATGKAVPLPKLPEGDITSVRISRSEKKMSFYVNGDRSPSNLWVYEFGAPAARRLTSSLNPQIDPQDLVEAEVVRFKSFDGMTVPSIFFKPQGASADQPGSRARLGARRTGRTDAQGLQRGDPVPGQPRLRGARDQQPRQLRLRQDLLHRGRPEARQGAALGLRGGKEVPGEPALRGSGADRDHRRQLRRLHGARRAGLQAGGVRGRGGHLRRLELAPDDREHPEVVGVLPARALQGDGRPGEGPGDAARRSRPSSMRTRSGGRSSSSRAPTTRACSKPESDDIVAAAKKNGVPVEYVVFPDEGHGFTKRANEITAWKAIGDFLDKHLKASPAPAAKAAAP